MVGWLQEERESRGLKGDSLSVPVLISPQTITLIGTILGSAAVSANPPFDILVAMIVSKNEVEQDGTFTTEG
jgi:hypothetical protein